MIKNAQSKLTSNCSELVNRIGQSVSSKKNGFWITSVERTLIDCLTYKKLVARQTAIEAIRLAIAEKKTTLHALITMAEKLKVIHLIYPTLETFA